MEKYQSRKDVPEEYKMDLTDFYSSIEAWEKEEKEVAKEIENLVSLTKITANNLENFLNNIFEIERKLENLQVYAFVASDLDLADEKYYQLQNQVTNLVKRYLDKTASFPYLLSRCSNDEFNSLFKENTNLKKYAKYLEKIYETKEHILNENDEKIVNQLSETFDLSSDLSSRLLNSEHKYGTIKDGDDTVTIAVNNYGHLLCNKDQKFRKKVYKSFNKTLKQYQNTAAMLLNNYIKNEINLSKVYHYENPWESHIQSIHLPNEVFENLKEVAHNGAPLYQKFLKLHSKVTGCSPLHAYDLKLNWQDNQADYTILEAQQLVLKALEPLGKPYLEKIQKIFDHHDIDYCQYHGKVSGGYNISTASHSSKIVMSFNGHYQDVSTIIHEAGHHVNHQFITLNNPSWYRDCTNLTAEIASLTNEFLLNSYVGTHGKTKQEKLMGIEYNLKLLENNFFSAVLEGEMEQEMYNYVLDGNALTASYLNDLRKKMLKSYQGNTVKRDELSYFSWITRSHYFMEFYLYSYAVCVSVAANVSRRILNKEENILEKYYDFLSSGLDILPKDIYTKLDIDITSPQVFIDATTFFKEQLEMYQSILREDDKHE